MKKLKKKVEREVYGGLERLMEVERGLERLKEVYGGFRNVK